MSSTVPTTPARKLPSRPATHCPSCAAEATGSFCAACGETLHHHLPTAREFAHEFIGHYVALEGKLLQTMKLLLFRPGRLTVDFMHGRRLPYIAPLRLYLTLSLVMFALVKWYGAALPQLNLNPDAIAFSYSHLVDNPVNPGKKGLVTLAITLHEGEHDKAILKAGKKPAEPMLRDEIRMAIDQLGKVNPAWMANVKAFMAAPEAQQTARLNQGFLANFPYMLIAALPLFALYLKGLYRGSGRVYGEHLVFALHANAFAFLLASVMVACPGSAFWVVAAGYEHMLHLTSPWDYVQLLPLAWLLAYLPVAMLRVYGGTAVATAGKWAVLMTVHLLMIAVLTICAELIGVIGNG